MRLRSRAIRHRSDVEHASPGTVGEVSQAPEIEEHGGHHETVGESTEAGPSWQDEPVPLSTAPPAAQQPWNPQDSAGSDRVPFGPPHTDFYPESDVQYTNEGWRYEVKTDNEIFRISTTPSDFFGNTSVWPPEAVADHAAYKAAELPMERARDKCVRANNEVPRNNAKLYYLIKSRYEHTLPPMKARANFMKTWPSAFNYAESHRGHEFWAEGIVEQAQLCQLHARDKLKEAQPDTDSSTVEWLNEDLDIRTVVGPRIYAMSPHQYIYLRQRIQERKVRKREEFDDTSSNWEARVSPHPTLSSPNLPPLKPEVAPPQSSNQEEATLTEFSDVAAYIHRLCEDASSSLPDKIFESLWSDKCSA